MTYRRYRLILSAVLRDGRWAGIVRGGRVEIERHAGIIHWSACQNDESMSGTAQTVRRALDACA